jgi:hypothetical protein
MNQCKRVIIRTATSSIEVLLWKVRYVHGSSLDTMKRWQWWEEKDSSVSTRFDSIIETQDSRPFLRDHESFNKSDVFGGN